MSNDIPYKVKFWSGERYLNRKEYEEEGNKSYRKAGNLSTVLGGIGGVGAAAIQYWLKNRGKNKNGEV
ncbi:MAG: hypothetical protein LBI26_02120 [Holosporales bacterium]|jgi:hypothetical protein|nr:hypothetical protein [Holosporales bacterium]